MDEPNKIIRPTKKQLLLLEFIEKFILEHGYGPSYREVMAGCNYTSVATVAVHINNLIKRGHIRKNGRSARSLEIVNPSSNIKHKLQTNAVLPSEEKWLIEKVDYYFKQYEGVAVISQDQINDLKVLISAMRIMGLDSATSTFNSRLNVLSERIIKK